MIVSSGSFTLQPFAIQNWPCLALLLKRDIQAVLLCLLLRLCRVSMAIRGENKLCFLLAHCHQAGYLCVVSAFQGRRVNQSPQGRFQPAETFVVTHKLGGTLI